MPTIERVHAREVLDSRGRPTVEVEVICAGHRPGRAIVPSGASTGRHEACELRDGGIRLDGLGVRNAVNNVRSVLGPAIIGHDVTDQAGIDRRLIEVDGTENKSRLGANAILGVSLAVAHAAAETLGVPLVEHLHALWMGIEARESTPPGPPFVRGGETRDWRRSGGEPRAVSTPTGQSPAASFPPPLRRGGYARGMRLPLPMVNMISGGLHAGRNLDFQDFLIVPVGAASYSEALDWIVTVYRRLGQLLQSRGFEGVLVGDEGGYGPRLSNNRQAVELIVEAIGAARLRPGPDVSIALDVASTHFWDGQVYRLAGEGNRTLDAGQMTDLLEDWLQQFPIVSIEDPLADDDWEGWKELTVRLGDKVQLVGDDLFVTNAARLKRGIDEHVANSVLIKVNQIGTLSETLATLRLALDAGYAPVISARSGETEDATIADLAVATGAGQIKIGSVARSERLAKYNQLLRLEEMLGSRAAFHDS